LSLSFFLFVLTSQNSTSFLTISYPIGKATSPYQTKQESKLMPLTCRCLG
jgi:hypothetical protein